MAGCGKDLSGLKEYHQRYRICEVHIRLPQVLKDSRLQRFCESHGQQLCGGGLLMIQSRGAACSAFCESQGRQRVGGGGKSRGQTEDEQGVHKWV